MYIPDRYTRTRPLDQLQTPQTRLYVYTSHYPFLVHSSLSSILGNAIPNPPTPKAVYVPSVPDESLILCGPDQWEAGLRYGMTSLKNAAVLQVQFRFRFQFRGRERLAVMKRTMGRCFGWLAEWSYRMSRVDGMSMRKSFYEEVVGMKTWSIGISSRTEEETGGGGGEAQGRQGKGAGRRGELDWNMPRA
jgi:hypothetical protein